MGCKGASEVECNIAEGLGPDACDKWPKVLLEANLKWCRPGLGSVGPSPFKILISDVGSGMVWPRSKLAGEAKCGREAEARDGCGTILRELERLENG